MAADFNFSSEMPLNSCKAKTSGNCGKLFLIVDRLELPVGVDELKPVGTVQKKLVCVFLLYDEVFCVRFLY